MCPPWGMLPCGVVRWLSAGNHLCTGAAYGVCPLRMHDVDSAPCIGRFAWGDVAAHPYTRSTKTRCDPFGLGVFNAPNCRFHPSRSGPFYAS